MLLFTIGTPDTVPRTTPTGSAGSTSDTIPAIRQFSPSLEVLRQDTDKGYASANADQDDLVEGSGSGCEMVCLRYLRFHFHGIILESYGLVRLFGGYKQWQHLYYDKKCEKLSD